MIHAYHGVVPKVRPWIAGVNRNGTPTIGEEYVTIGHAARLHGCHIKSAQSA
jgi:carbonic anhydrase/acetyltransferase-like protein (isoleucine patch superfamily)